MWPWSWHESNEWKSVGTEVFRWKLILLKPLSMLNIKMGATKRVTLICNMKYKHLRTDSFFITNIWDYGSLIASALPSEFRKSYFWCFPMARSILTSAAPYLASNMSWTSSYCMETQTFFFKDVVSSLCKKKTFFSRSLRTIHGNETLPFRLHVNEYTWKVIRLLDCTKKSI